MPKDTELHKLCGKGDFDGVQSLLSPSAKPVNVDEPGSSGEDSLTQGDWRKCERHK